MPLYPPRNESIKKKEQLAQSIIELKHIFLHDSSGEQISKAIEKYRRARLSLLKAKIHEAIEMDYKNKPTEIDINKVNNEIQIWSEKSVEEITKEFKLAYGL